VTVAPDGPSERTVGLGPGYWCASLCSTVKLQPLMEISGFHLYVPSCLVSRRLAFHQLFFSGPAGLTLAALAPIWGASPCTYHLDGADPQGPRAGGGSDLDRA